MFGKESWVWNIKMMKRLCWGIKFVPALMILKVWAIAFLVTSTWINQTKESISESVRPSGNKSVSKVSTSTWNWLSQSVSQPASQLASQSINQPIRKSDSKVFTSTWNWLSQSVSQSGIHINMDLGNLKYDTLCLVKKSRFKIFQTIERPS